MMLPVRQGPSAACTGLPPTAKSLRCTRHLANRLQHSSCHERSRCRLCKSQPRPIPHSQHHYAIHTAEEHQSLHKATSVTQACTNNQCEVPLLARRGPPPGKGAHKYAHSSQAHNGHHAKKHQSTAHTRTHIRQLPPPDAHKDASICCNKRMPQSLHAHIPAVLSCCPAVISCGSDHNTTHSFRMHPPRQVSNTAPKANGSGFSQRRPRPGSDPKSTTTLAKVQKHASH